MTGIKLRSLLGYLVAHPQRVLVVVPALWQMRARGWWRRAPYLPLPGRHYWEFRVVTAQGGRSHTVSGEEVVAAAQWARRQRSGR